MLCVIGTILLLSPMTDTAFSQQLVGEGKIFIRFTNMRSDETYLSPVLCGVETTDEEAGLHLPATGAAIINGLAGKLNCKVEA